MANFTENPDLNAAAFAFIGAVISRMIRPNIPTWLWVANWFASGFISYTCAVFFTSLIGKPNSLGFVAIFIGLFGLAICSTLEEIRQKTDWAGIIKSRFGGQ